MRSLIYIVLLLSTFITAEDSKKLRILFSNSENGHIYGCTCPVSPKSGLIKRAVFIRDYLSKYQGETLLFSTGDLVYVVPNASRAEEMILSLETLPYDAIVPGEQDFINGISFFHNKMRNLPLLLANISYSYQGKIQKLPGSMIKNVSGVKVGIIAAIDETTFNFPSLSKVKPSLIIENYEIAIKRELSKIKNSCQIVVLLSHLGIQKDRELAKKMSGIDLIIGGHSQYLTKKPEVINNTIILQAGVNGNFQGELVMDLDNKNKIINHSVVFHFFRYTTHIQSSVIIGRIPFETYSCKIHDNPPDDPQVLKAVRDFRSIPR